MFKELNDEFSIRFEEFLKTSKDIKAEILKAKDNIQRNHDILLDIIQKNEREQQRKTLEQYLLQIKLDLCIIGPEKIN